MRIIRICCVAALVISCSSSRGTAAGPLRVHPDNPRYFTDGVHPNRRGHKMLARSLADRILGYFEELRGIAADDG